MKNSGLLNYYQQNHNAYLLKLRRVENFDASKISAGLAAMDYDIQSFPEDDTIKLFIKGISIAPLVIRENSFGIDLSLSYFSSPSDWELMRDWLMNFFNFSDAIAIAENELVEDMELFFSEKMIEEQQNLFR